MKNDNESTEIGKQYAAAHKVHYEGKDLLEALGLYRNIINLHQNTLEAGYAQSQIQNIVDSVVPQQELFDAQVDMALSHLRKSKV